MPRKRTVKSFPPVYREVFEKILDGKNILTTESSTRARSLRSEFYAYRAALERSSDPADNELWQRIKDHRFRVDGSVIEVEPAQTLLTQIKMEAKQ